MAANATLLSASEQTAITHWTRRHRVTLWTLVGGLATLTALNTYLLPGMLLSKPVDYLFWALALWLARYWVGLWWWTNRRRRLLAKHSLPAPGFRQMHADRKIERHRVKLIEKQWPAFCEANGYRGVGKIVPKLRKFQGTVEGDITCMVSPGPIAVKGGVDKLVTLAWDLKEVTGDGCNEVLVRRVGAGHAFLTFLWTEALERVLPIADMPAGKPGAVAYGTRRDGSAATVRMCEPVLCGGMTGSGKSGWAWALLADLNRQNIAYDLHVSNLKGGAEFKAYKDREGQKMGPVRVAAYAEDVPETVRLIGQFEREMKARSKVFPHRQWKPEHADEYPLTILVLDESVELMVKMTTAQRASLDTCLSQSRALGFWVIMLSQRGQVEILKSTRGYIPQRLALAMQNATETNMFLGDGAEGEGALCSKIVNRPGVGYSYDERRRGYELFRAARVDDDDMERIAAGLIPAGMDGKAKLPVSRACGVYLMFSTAGQSIYVGKGFDPAERWADHAGERNNPAKWWWEHVDQSKTQVLWCDTEPAALELERLMIAKYLPVGNEQHNKANPLRGRVPEPLPIPVRPEPTNVTPITRTRPPTRTRRTA